MNAARRVIEKFGGQTALATLLGRRQSTVQHWVRTGIIPARWQGELLRVAAESGIELTAADFLAEQDAPVTASVEPKIPEAKWWGSLELGEQSLPCYVLDDGRRVISRTGATDVLTGKKGGGNLDSYIGIEALRLYMPPDLHGQMIEFSIQNVVNKTVRGIEAELFLEICRAYIRAEEAGALTTLRQREIAFKASMFLAACAKVGLIALIDEATGYQYDRAEDALRFKLRVYLEQEMRQWEKTFPDELWREFGRLTNWTGSVTQRPKYWGKLVMELVYDYLDKDVADWLRKNAPKPQKGENYHQWLSSQYGLRKLTEHLWMLIGMASACQNMRELRAKMAERYGRQPVQFTLYLPSKQDRQRSITPGQQRPQLPPPPDDEPEAPGEAVVI